MLKFIIAATLVVASPTQSPLFRSEGELRLISTSNTEAEWRSEESVMELIRQKQKFVDVTDGLWNEIEATRISNFDLKFPEVLTQRDTVEKGNALINQTRMKAFLQEFTSFHTRYYSTDSGAAASEFLYNHITKLAETTSDDVRLTVRKFKHSFKQPSVIARLEPKGHDKRNEEIVILSAHLDSVNVNNPQFGRSPGADDNGSGTTTVMEALTVLLGSNFVPSKRIIEFHWYANEETGLRGSQQVVASYMKKKKNVFAVLHSDMTGYQPDGEIPVVAFATDNTNAALTESLRKIASGYSGLKAQDTECGYGCSDHVSWTRAGVPSSFSFESRFESHSPFIHSIFDTVSHIDFDHITAFVKTAVGFAVEISLF